MKAATQKADILIEAIKYIKKFEHKVIVVKYGGNAMENPAIRDSVFEDIAMLWQLGLKIVLVHGAGPKIDQTMARQGLTKQVVHGLRVTDQATLDIVEQVLHEINQDCVKQLEVHHAEARDCTDGVLVTKIIDLALGFVGAIEEIRTDRLLQALEQGSIPVISSIGRDASGQTTNINADTVASAVASALQAEKLTILTDIDAVMDANKERIRHLSIEQAQALMGDGTIHTGMIPKVRACIEAVSRGVTKAHLLNGITPRALLIEIFTDTGIGTEIVR